MAETAENCNPIDNALFEHVRDLYGYDRALPLQAKTQFHWPYRNPYITEKVNYRSTHEQWVPGYFVYPKEGQGPWPAVVLVHGANGPWGKNEDLVLEKIDVLVREGYCVLAIDNYRFGERMPREAENLWNVGPYSRRDSMIQSVTDQRRGIDYLFSRDEVDKNLIFLVGGSLGAYLGTLIAALDDRLSAAVLIVNRAREGGTRDPLGRSIHPLNFAPRVQCPTLMINATRDELATKDSVEELYAFLPDPKKLAWVESEHVVSPQIAKELILSWFGEHRK